MSVHSVIFEDDCVFEFEVIGRAQLLHGEVLSLRLKDFIHFTVGAMNRKSNHLLAVAHVFDRWIAPIVVKCNRTIQLPQKPKKIRSY